MSSNFSPEEARNYMLQVLKMMHQAGGSDLFISADFPASIKLQGQMRPLSKQKLTRDMSIDWKFDGEP